MKFDVIILAAGSSTRFGENKLLKKIKNDICFLDLIYQTYSSLKVIENIILVIGDKTFRNDLTNWALKKYISIVINSDYKSGMFSSIKKGLEKSSELSENNFFIHPGDCPFVTSNLLFKLIKKSKINFDNKSVIIPSYNFKRGHPPLFKMTHKKNILSKPNDFNLRKYYTEINNEITYINCENNKILLDFDYKKDIKKFFYT